MFKFYIFTKLWRIEVPTRGPDSRFVLEAIIKALISKSSLCSICYQKFEKSKFPIFLIRRTWKGKIIYLLIKRKRVRFDPQISFCKNFNFMGVDVNGRTSEFVDASYRHHPNNCLPFQYWTSSDFRLPLYHCTLQKVAQSLCDLQKIIQGLITSPIIIFFVHGFCFSFLFTFLFSLFLLSSNLRRLVHAMILKRPPGEWLGNYRF